MNREQRGRSQALVETVQDWLAEARVDSDTGRLLNVALLGPESRNGYRYTADAMQAAVPLYEGRPVFLNHPGGQGPLARKVQDYVGKIVAARFQGGRIRGDIQMVGPNRTWVAELAQSNPSEIGMSHVVIARRAGRGEPGDVVEAIEKVLSVDIVAFPATTHSFAESWEPAGMQKRLEETEARLRQAERALELERKLREAGVSRVLLTERWIAHLLELEPAEQDAEIRQRQRLGRLLEAEAPQSREKVLEGEAAVGTAARRRFVAAVRGR